MSLKHFEILETFEMFFMSRNVTESVTFLYVIGGNCLCDIENKMYTLLHMKHLFKKPVKSTAMLTFLYSSEEDEM
jgi:hypothetical protein